MQLICGTGIQVAIWNDADPYMQAIALDDKGKRLTRYTSTKSGNLIPTWNEELYLGWGTWEKVWIHFYDADDNADDPLSDDVPFGLAIGGDYEQSIHCYRDEHAQIKMQFRPGKLHS